MVTSQQSNALGDVLKGCMAQRGYMPAPASQATALSAQYKAAKKS
jgi:hypothetical protein